MSRTIRYLLLFLLFDALVVGGYFRHNSMGRRRPGRRPGLDTSTRPTLRAARSRNSSSPTPKGRERCPSRSGTTAGTPRSWPLPGKAVRPPDRERPGPLLQGARRLDGGRHPVQDGDRARGHPDDALCPGRRPVEGRRHGDASEIARAAGTRGGRIRSFRRQAGRRSSCSSRSSPVRRSGRPSGRARCRGRSSSRRGWEAATRSGGACGGRPAGSGR